MITLLKHKRRGRKFSHRFVFEYCKYVGIFCAENGITLCVITECEEHDVGDLRTKEILKAGFDDVRAWLVANGLKDRIVDWETKKVPPKEIYLKNNWNEKIDKVCKKHGGRRLSDVLSVTDRVILACPIHGKWETSAMCVIYNETWCYDCTTYVRLPKNKRLEIINNWVKLRQSGKSWIESAKEIGINSDTLNRMKKELEEKGYKFGRIKSSHLTDEEKLEKVKEFYQYRNQGLQCIEAANKMGYTHYKILYTWRDKLDPDKELFQR